MRARKEEKPRDPPGLYPSGAAGWVREWDGHAWSETIVADPQAVALETWHRRPLAVLAHGRFLMWFGCWLLAIALAAVFLWTGAIFFAVLGGLIGVVGVLGALLWMMFRRLHLHEVISFAELNLWGVGGGVVALLVAGAIEYGVAALIHHETPIQGLGIAGPVEETAKILVPVILYVVGRYRDPRAGIALALVSGAMFGLCEDVSYLLRQADLTELVSGSEIHLPDVFTMLFRPFVEVFHVVLTGFIAAVAWRAGWVRGKFWPALIGAWLLAAVLHSGYDVIDGFSQRVPLIEVASLAIILITYFVVFRGSARQLPPPAALAANPPAWRPTLPKKRTDAAVGTDAAVRDDGAVRRPAEQASH